MGPSLGPKLARSAKRAVARYGPWLASEAASKAWYRALNAYGFAEVQPSLAVKGAQAALAISPQCPEALYLLGRLKANSYEEALDLFNRGSENYEKLLSAEGWAKCRLAYPHIATAPPLHGIVRCRVGAVHALCRMRRGAQAYEQMQAILRVTPPLRQVLVEEAKETEPTRDIWALAPEVVYRAKGPAACLAWMSEHVCDQVLGLRGAAVWWIATYALAWAATHQEEGFKWASLYAYENEMAILGLTDGDGGDGDSDSSSSDGRDMSGCLRRRMLSARPRGASDKLRGGMALAVCCCWLPHLVDMLTGDMPPPPGPIPPVLLSSSAMGAQVAYVRFCGDMWRNTPGVIDFVRRYRNTYEVFCIISDSRTGRQPSLTDFRHFLAPFPPAAPPPPASAAPAAEEGRTSNGVGGSSGNGFTASGAAGAGRKSFPGSTGAAAAPGSGSGGSLLPSSSLDATGIFPDGILYEGYAGWHGLIEMLCTFTDKLAASSDSTMSSQDLEMLKLLLAAGCPLEASKRRPNFTPGPNHSPLVLSMHRGYGADAVRELLKAGADPMELDESGLVPLIQGAEQGMWRELQAVFKARRKLGLLPVPVFWWYSMAQKRGTTIMLPPVPRNVFELLLEVTLRSSCVPCVMGTRKGCVRCTPDGDRDTSCSPHGPWCNFSKVLEVLVAYGMNEVWEPMVSYLETTDDGMGVSIQGPRRQLLDELRRLLREAARRKVKESPQQGQQQWPTANGDDKGAATAGAQGGLPPQQQQQHPKSPRAATRGAESPARALPPPAHPTPPLASGAAACVEGAVASSGPEGEGKAAPSSGPPGRSLSSRDKARCCWSCGKEKDRTAGVKMRLCSTCRVARYCGEECQREHWAVHKLECKLLEAAVKEQKEKKKDKKKDMAGAKPL